MTETNDEQASDSQDSGCGIALLLLWISIPVGSIGIAGFFLYRGTTRYLEGIPIASSDVFTPFLIAVIFLGVGLGFLRRLVSGGSEESEEDAPWTARPEWRTTEIPEKGRSAQWIIGTVVVNLFSFPFAGFILYSVVWQARNPGFELALFAAFILIFPSIGVWMVWTVVRDILHGRKFGQSTLQLETMPVRLGQELEARLRAGMPPEKLSKRGMEVELSCYRWVHGAEGRSRKRLKWQEDATVPRASISRGADGVEVPISFDVPADQPPSSPEDSGSGIEWELDATAEVSGLDYDVTFTVPVFEPDA